MRSTHDEVEVTLTVASRDLLAEGVVVLGLADADGAPLPSWAPGAHIDLYLGQDLSRQYSLCGNVQDVHRWQVGVLLEAEGRGGSRYVHEHLHIGTQLKARGPRNHFELLPASRYLFIAGGIGITPLIPMIEDAESRGVDWSLLYGGRTISSMAFLDRLSKYGDRVAVQPQDTHGLLDLASLLGEPSDDTLVYCCGPEALLDAVEAQMSDWKPDALHLERFTPKTIETPISEQTFEVELVRSGITLHVTPDTSILEAAIAAGVDAPSSCEEGTCGTCETVVIAGEPEHRDSLLSPAEQAANETMMICVSRANCPRLVLDL